jgi:hypothetical protein
MRTGLRRGDAGGGWRRARRERSGAEHNERKKEEERISLQLQPTGDEDRGGGHAGWHEAVGAVELGAPVGTSGRGLKWWCVVEMLASGPTRFRYFLNEIHSFANFELQNRCMRLELDILNNCLNWVDFKFLT